MHRTGADVVARLSNLRRSLHQRIHKVACPLVGAFHHPAQGRAVAIGAIQQGIAQAARAVLAQPSVRIHHLRPYRVRHRAHKVADKTTVRRRVQFAAVVCNEVAEVRQTVGIRPRLFQRTHAQAAALVRGHRRLGNIHRFIQLAHQYRLIHPRNLITAQAELFGIVHQVLPVAFAVSVGIRLRQAHHAPVATDDGAPVIGQSRRAGAHFLAVAQQFRLQVLRDMVYLHLRSRPAAVAVLVIRAGHRWRQLVRFHQLQACLPHLIVQIHLGLPPQPFRLFAHLFGCSLRFPRRPLHLLHRLAAVLHAVAEGSLLVGQGGGSVRAVRHPYRIAAFSHPAHILRRLAVHLAMGNIDYLLHCFALNIRIRLHHSGADYIGNRLVLVRHIQQLHRAARTEPMRQPQVGHRRRQPVFLQVARVLLNIVAGHFRSQSAIACLQCNNLRITFTGGNIRSVAFYHRQPSAIDKAAQSASAGKRVLCIYLTAAFVMYHQLNRALHSCIAGQALQIRRWRLPRLIAAVGRSLLDAVRRIHHRIARTFRHSARTRGLLCSGHRGLRRRLWSNRRGRRLHITMYRAAQTAPDTALQYPAQQPTDGRFFAVIHPRLAVLLPLVRAGFQ